MVYSNRELPVSAVKALVRVVGQHTYEQRLVRDAAIVFEGIGIFDVGVAVFSGNLGFLADHMIPCGDKMASLTREQLIKLLRMRLRPVKRLHK